MHRFQENAKQSVRRIGTLPEAKLPLNEWSVLGNKFNDNKRTANEMDGKFSDLEESPRNYHRNELQKESQMQVINEKFL